MPRVDEAASAATVDPRTALESESERDIRPMVRHSRTGISGAGIAVLAAVAGMGLFGVLEARRQSATAPAARVTSADGVGVAAPPPLYLPPPPAPIAPAVQAPSAPAPSGLVTPVPPAPAIVTPEPIISSAPAPDIAPPPATPVQAASPPRNVSGQALVIDTSTGVVPEAAEEADKDAKTGDNKRPALSTTRARAAMLANRSTTVPQGTLIPAVLETGFDSTSPGFARALVQKDVHGFDGTRVLIPRGSRLIGEYGADTERGQKRAVILWSRLIRPDGVTIAIGSPAADPVGRGGVKADVNSHFLERFSGAILQSAFDLGITLAARSSRSPVIVALPGAGGRVASTVPTQGTDIAPTLRVPPGRSVSVFVARDLDFTEADGVR